MRRSGPSRRPMRGSSTPHTQPGSTWSWCAASWSWPSTTRAGGRWPDSCVEPRSGSSTADPSATATSRRFAAPSLAGLDHRLALPLLHPEAGAGARSGPRSDDVPVLRFRRPADLERWLAALEARAAERSSRLRLGRAVRADDLRDDPVAALFVLDPQQGAGRQLVADVHGERDEAVGRHHRILLAAAALAADPAVTDRHGARQPVGDLGIVGDDNHRRALLLVDPQQGVEDALAGDPVERAGGLVGEQDAGRGSHGDGQGGHLQLALREAAEASRRRTPSRRRAPGRGRPRSTSAPSRRASAWANGDILADREVRE